MIVERRYRIKDRRVRKRLREYAVAVNQVWNYCVAQQRDVQARYRAGAKPRRWASRFDLCNLTAGSSTELGISAKTIQDVCRQFARNRWTTKRCPRFRASFGSRRALGWIPFTAQNKLIEGDAVIYRGDRYRVWLGGRPLPADAQSGCFVEDSRGRWYVCLWSAAELQTAGEGAIGIDLGLKTLAACSDGTLIENPTYLRRYADKLAVAHRANNKTRLRALYAKVVNARRDFLHKRSTEIARAHSFIAVGNVDAASLKKTRLRKAVSDAGWATFRRMLEYKARMHQASFVVVAEAWTSRTCSSCGAIPDSSPKGMGALRIREWVCSECGVRHDRDVNAAKNILARGRGAPPLAEGSGETRRAQYNMDQATPPSL